MTTENPGQWWDVLDTFDEHIAVLDTTGAIVAVNAAWMRFGSENKGSPTSCGVGRNYVAACRSVADDQGAFAAAAGISRVLDGALPIFAMEYRGYAAGRERWFVMTARPLHRADGGGAVVTQTDVTERKEAETDRAQRAESFSTLFHGTAEAMVIHDGTAFVAVNEVFADLLGLEPAQVTGRPLLEFVAPDSHTHAAEQGRAGPEIPYNLVA